MTVNTVNGFAVNTSDHGVAGATEINLGDAYYVTNYGADPTNVADSTAAFQAAINAASTYAAQYPGSTARVYAPSGKYRIAGQLVGKPNVELWGYGATLIMVTAQQDAIVYNNSTLTDVNFYIRGLRFFTSVANSYAVSFTLCRYVGMFDCTFVGLARWVRADRVQKARFDNITVEGSATLPAGVGQILSTSTTDYSFSVMLSNYIGQNTGTGWVGAPLQFGRCVGLRLDGAEINDVRNGGLFDAIQLTGDCQGCRIESVLVGTAASGIYLGPDLFTSSTVNPSFCALSDCNLDQCSTAGIYIAQAAYISVVGAKLTSSGDSASTPHVGLLIGDSSHPTAQFITAAACNINGFNGTPSGNGVLIAANISDITVTGCTLNNNVTGIGVVSGSGQRLTLTSNNVFGNTTPISFGASLTSGNNIVRENAGSNVSN